MRVFFCCIIASEVSPKREERLAVGIIEVDVGVQIVVLVNEHVLTVVEILPLGVEHVHRDDLDSAVGALVAELSADRGDCKVFNRRGAQAHRKTFVAVEVAEWETLCIISGSYAGPLLQTR